MPDASREEAKPVFGCPGYYVTRTGRVFSTKRCSGDVVKELKPSVDRNGYLVVRLVDASGRKTGRMVHRLVLEAWTSPYVAGTLEADHKNRVRSDNSLGNLEWVTHAINVRRSRRPE